ncbi:MAG: hypothetical protein ABR502_05130 [Chitinophagaceae bacterium]
MNDYGNLFAQNILNKSLLNDCTIEEIKNIIHQYPYFSPAYYALLKKIAPGSEEYNRYYQTAILYHHNPLEFDLFIHSEKFETSYKPQKTGENLLPVSIVGTETVPQTNEQEPFAAVNASVESNQIIDEESAAINTDNKAFDNIEQKRNEQTSELAFEPFHTVDYFASQGIKLSQQEAADDRMGKQLKSFTEWLKSMKRLPAAELAKKIDVTTEKKVENLAEHSINDQDIVTEAMAEVWIKQGNTQKAKEVYEKLGLLNPVKRSYFAAKIEQIKDT